MTQKYTGGQPGSDASSIHLIYQWTALLRIAPVVAILHLVIIIACFLSSMEVVTIVHVCTLFVETFALIIVAFMATYVLAFLLLAANVLFVFYELMVIFSMLSDVLNCNSSHCNHGNKMVYSLGFWFISFLVGTLLYINNVLLWILKSNRRFDPPPIEPDEDVQVLKDE